MSFSWIVASILFLLIAPLLHYYVITPTLRRLKKLPPYVHTGPPFVGPAGLFGTDPVKLLQIAREKFGSVVCVDLMLTQMYFLLDQKHATFLFSAKSESVLSFKDAVSSFVEGLLPGQYEDENWNKIESQVISKAFMRKERLDAYFDTVVNEAFRHVNSWKALPAKTPINLFESCSTLVTAANIRVNLGDEAARNIGKELGKKYVELESLAFSPAVVPFVETDKSGFIHRAVSRLAHRVIPDCIKTDKLQKEVFEMVDDSIKSTYVALQKQREQEAKGELSHVEQKQLEERSDYCYFLCSTVGDKIDVNRIRMSVLGIVLAAHVNTAGTLGWTFSLLLRDKQFLKLVKDEIKRVFLGSENATWPQEEEERKKLLVEMMNLDRLSDLKVLEACIREAVRLYSVVLTFRQTTQAVEMDGYTIPERSLVCISPAYLHRRKEVFGNDVNEFNPMRFLKKDEAYPMEFELNDEFTKNQEFIQFGFGPHKCLGSQYATMLIKVALVSAFVVLDEAGSQIEFTEQTKANVEQCFKPDYSKAIGMPFPIQPIQFQLQ